LIEVRDLGESDSDKRAAELDMSLSLALVCRDRPHVPRGGEQGWVATL
jgi:hypothetical protein